MRYILDDNRLTVNSAMNKEKQRLTMTLVKSLMDESYTLVWVDYQENFDENLDLLQQCIENRNCEELLRTMTDWYEDAGWQSEKEAIKELKDRCANSHGFGKDEIDAFFNEHDDEIRDEIRDRDDSTAIEDLIKNTKDIPVRVEMLSNYDCIGSFYCESESGFRYEKSYFGDMVDTLRLNPAKVKKILVDKGYAVYGRFPDKKCRDGKEQVSYEDFCEELENSCCGGNLLTYIGHINAKDLYDANFDMIRKDGYGFRLQLDNEKCGYSITHVYGTLPCFFGKRISIAQVR